MRSVIIVLLASFAAACAEPTPEEHLATRCRPAMEHSYWSGCSTETATTYAQSLPLADAVALCTHTDVAEPECRPELEAWIACNELTAAPNDCSCADAYSALVACRF